MDITSWVFTAIGVILLFVASLFVFRQHTISTGQALLFALGVALVAMPHVVNFEWSDGGIKFTTKEATATLTDQVKSITEQQKEINDQIKILSQTVKDTSERMNSVLASIKSNDPSVTIPSTTVVPPETWKNFLDKNEKINEQSLQTIFKLDNLQQELAPATK
ncbi:hypothetical protein [Roseibium sp.]|uniref:hypothetical protein n=1 Tax=Roseibium sp. TaxID=1936156 RepID=UPI003A978496